MAVDLLAIIIDKFAIAIQFTLINIARRPCLYVPDFTLTWRVVFTRAF